MSTAAAETQPKISISARVFRIDWNRRPRWISKGIWMWLGKRRVSFTGRWEDLGEIATSEDGSASIQH